MRMNSGTIHSAVTARAVSIAIIAMIAISAMAVEPTVRLPALVLKDNLSNVIGPVIGQNVGDVQFLLWDAARGKAIPMNFRASGTFFFLDAADPITYYSGSNCTGTVYIPQPAGYRVTPELLNINYTAAKSPSNSDIILYRGEGVGTTPAVMSDWSGGLCTNSPTIFFSRPLVAAVQILDVSQTYPLPWTLSGDGDMPISMNALGKVGIGTLSQTEKVHVIENANANTLLVVENPNAGASAAGVLRVKSNSATLNFQAHAAARSISRFGQTLGGWDEMLAVAGNGFILGTLGATPLILGTNNANRLTITASGNVGIGLSSTIYPLEVAGGAYVSGGAWIDGSSRESKFDIHSLDPAAARKAVSSLEPVTFRYKNEKDEVFVGFIAEDVPKLVAMNDRKSLNPMDIVAVLTKVVQEQNRTIEELNARVKALETKLH